VSNISDKTLSELRIAQAYVKLLCVPQGSSKASVTLVWVGNCEIRIFEGSQACSDGVPLSAVPQQRTFRRSLTMSGKCQEETHALQQMASLFDQLVGKLLEM
jgi:hypothetical protein